VVASHLFVTPMDWLLNCTSHCAFLVTTADAEPFPALYVADDVALILFA